MHEELKIIERTGIFNHGENGLRLYKQKDDDIHKVRSTSACKLIADVAALFSKNVHARMYPSACLLLETITRQM